MKVTLPEKVTGARDALFVLEVEFPVATEERVVEVVTTGAIESLDLSGSSRGGTYRVPVGLERLHVPLRVTEDATGQATVKVTCTEGPEAGRSDERTLALEEAVHAGGASSKRWIGIGVAVVLVAGAAWGLSALLGKGGLPDLRGLTHEEAEARLADENLTPNIRYETAERPEDEGVVVRTIPAAGEDVPDSGVVEVVLGRPADQIGGIPAVVGELAEDAEAALKAVGYLVITTMEDVDDPSQVGRVTGQSPAAGTPLAPRSQVEIFVGRAPAAFEVPPLAGLTADAAREELEALELVVVVEEREVSDPAAVGTVVASRPAMGDTVTPGSTVTVVVGRAATTAPMPPPVEPPPVEPPPVEPPPVEPPPPPIEPTPPPVEPTPPPVEPVPTAEPLVPDANGQLLIPDMTGWTREEAEDRLRAVGLVPVVTLQPSPTAADAGRVIRHRPEAGERRSTATMIFLTVGDGTPPVEPAPPVIPEPLPPDVPEPTPPVIPEPLPPDVPEPTPPDVPEPLPPDVPTPEPVPPLPPDVPEPMPPVVPDTPEPPPAQPGKPRTVPDVVGESRERAEGIIRRAGFHYLIVLKVTDYPADGTVLGQDPAPGVSLPAGGEVVLEVAKAPADAKIAVPGVLGVERAVAERMLRDAGFLVNVTLGGGAPGEQGKVVDQAPAGEALAPRRSWVEIVVASGSGVRRTARGGPPDIGRTPAARVPPPPSSAGLEGAPAVGPGAVHVPPPTPRGPAPLPPVELPPRGAPKTANVPATVGRNARDAVAAVLEAQLIPIIEVDRSSAQAAGSVVKQSPEAATGALPGDLVRLTVAAGTGGGRYVDLPTTIGAEITRARRMFAGTGTPVNVVELRVPGHPYAGTGRVAAQYPVSRMPASQAAPVTLWVILR